MRIYFVTQQQVFADTLKFYLSHTKPDWIFDSGDVPESEKSYDICMIDMAIFDNSSFSADKLIEEAPKWSVVCALGRLDLKPILQEQIRIDYAFPADVTARVLFAFIERVRDGHAPDQSEFLFLKQQRNKEIPAFLDLTKREREVLGFLKKGASNKEIANNLSIEVVTVKLHVRGICNKLNVVNRTQAALLAQKWGV